MNRVLSFVFVIMFFITGCSIDSLFEGGATQWVISFLIMLLVAWALFGGRDD